MNTPSPLVPQGSLLEQKNKGRSRVKVAFFCVVGVHVAAILTALLAQGCKRDTSTPPTTETAQPAVPVAEPSTPAFDPNVPIGVVDTNPPAVLPIPVDPAPTVAIPPPTVPEIPTVAAQEYEVQKGDSFYSIGKKFNVSMKAIQEANPNVNPNRLQIGAKLNIPSPAAPAANGGTPSPAGSEQVYVVKAGDNLTKIAAQHGVTINALRRANNLTTDRIKVGDKLKIPAPAPR